MQRGQFLLLASLMTVASLLGGSVASVIVSSSAKEFVEAPEIYLVDHNQQRIGAIGIDKNGSLKIMRLGVESPKETLPGEEKE